MLSVVTVFPPVSVIVTVGWRANGVPCGVERLGWVENTMCAAAPTVTFNGLLVAAVGPVVTVASSVYVVALARSILHPRNVATPAAGVRGFALVHVSAAPAGFDGCVIVNVTGLALPTTVLPPASCTATLGWVPKATPPVELLGCAMKPSLAGAPIVIVKGLLVVAVGPVVTVARSV